MTAPTKTFLVAILRNVIAIVEAFKTWVMEVTKA